MSAVPASGLLVVLLAALAAMAALVGMAPEAARDARALPSSGAAGAPWLPPTGDAGDTPLPGDAGATSSAVPRGEADGRSRRTESPGAGRSRVLRWRTTAGGRAARAERSATQELGVIGTIAAALEAGLPVARAVALAVPEPTQEGADGPDWRPLARAAGEGQGLAPVWARLGHVTGSPTLAAVARSWAVATRSGAPIADALRVSAHVARERQRLERAVGAASAGARATATVLTWLPVAGVALSAVLGVGPVALYGTPPALLCLGAGAVLLLVGQLLVRRLVAQVMADVR